MEFLILNHFIDMQTDLFYKLWLLFSEFIFSNKNILILSVVYSMLILITAVNVIKSPNPIMAVFSLVLVFVNSVVLFLILGTEFYALIFAIVYIGAIATLFLFVVMMLNLRIILSAKQNYNYAYVGASVIIISLFGVLIYSLHNIDFPINELVLYEVVTSNTADALFADNISPWWMTERYSSSLSTFAELLYSRYLILLIISAIVLAVALVGTMTLAYYKKKQRIELNLLQNNLVTKIIRK